MKETQIHIQDQVQIFAQVQAKKKRELIGTLIPENGHTLFEFNRESKVLTKAEFEECNVYMHGVSKSGAVVNYNVGTTKKVIVKENCFYVSSLNAKNAAKKIHKQLGVAYVIHVNE